MRYWSLDWSFIVNCFWSYHFVHQYFWSMQNSVTLIKQSWIRNNFFMNCKLNGIYWGLSLYHLYHVPVCLRHSKIIIFRLCFHILVFFLFKLISIFVLMWMEWVDVKCALELIPKPRLCLTTMTLMHLWI